jgi:hypothetical protein
VNLPGRHNKRLLLQGPIHLHNVSNNGAHWVLLCGIVPVIHPCLGFKVDAQLVKVRSDIVASCLDGRYCLVDREQCGSERVDTLLLELRANNKSSTGGWDLEAYSIWWDAVFAEKLDETTTMCQGLGNRMCVSR